MSAPKTIAVVLDTADTGRAAEALRAAVGLTLRGDRVVVVMLRRADPKDARVAKSIATLRALGHEVGASLAAVETADAVEVWT
jgi:hypothetical protein